MQIVCPHCSTSYGIKPASLGAAGRTVRCSRCKETWLARPEDAVEFAGQTFAAARRHRATGEQDAAAEWEALAAEESDTPRVDSPSIAGSWSSDQDEDSVTTTEADWPARGRQQGRFAWLSRLMAPQTTHRGPRKPSVGFTAACAAMGALTLGLIIWRAEMVRLLPQTAAFYKLAGLEVNLRALRFKDVRISSETVEGKPVLVIEGAITGESNRPVELPRLRFSVRDAQGAEIYAWNTVLEQSVLRPGERAEFRSRLASPPPEGRHIDVRFFNKRDLAGGHV
ncbi:MAG TPA: MJ0042-type zinc finger domain-containing protein [Bradyrhizobium sp.]|nr:MJ0042-type zinc finger domain-containing protein [Bradyrhizobium sp.]